MASEARLAANRQNAQKSTGPKTEAGKAKSKRNALKHGLSGKGVVLRRRDAKKVARRISDWRAVLCPINPLEDTLVERAALAAVRCESAVKQEAVERSRRVTRALSRIESKKRRQIAAIFEQLKTEPGRAGRALQELKRGVSWLIAEWKTLADRLRSRGHLCCTEAALMLRLLGLEPEMPYPDDAEVLAIRKAFVGALPELELEAAEGMLGLSAQDRDDPAREAAVSALLPDPAAARCQLQAIIAAELARLEARLADLATDRTEKLERAEAIRLAQVGLDTRSVGLHRYERDEEMSLHRNLNELIRIRKQEPDLASVARWEKMGKKFHRRWDGYQWVPNPEWEPASEDVVAGAAREDQEPKAEDLSPLAGPSLRSDPGTRDEGHVSGEAAPNWVPGAESETMPRMPASEAEEPRAGIPSHEQPLPRVPGVERSDPPDGVVPSEQALSRGGDPVPAANEPSSASGGSLCSTPGTRSDGHGEGRGEADLTGEGPSVVAGSSLRSDPAVWPGLSGACPGLPSKEPGLEASGLLAEGPVTATGGSPCSTPGTRSESHPEAAEADLPADDEVKVSGASLCSAPGTRPVADDRADSLQTQATSAAGFSALREPGALEPKEEPAEKATTDGKCLMTEQRDDPAPVTPVSQPLSHPPSVLSG